MPYEQLVFVPQVGFRPARARGTDGNVVMERDGLTFTGAVMPDRDGVRLAFTVSGVPGEEPTNGGPVLYRGAAGTARAADDQGREIARRPRWTYGGSLRNAGDGTSTLHWTLMLEAPRHDTQHLDLSFDGPAGEWTVRLPLVTIETHGTPGRLLDVTDSRHGITLAARAIARTTVLTAVELEAYLDPPAPATGPARRSLTGLGPCIGPGRLPGDQIVLREEAGERHLERGMPCMDQTGGKQRQTVMFPPITDGVVAGTIEIERMWVSEGEGDAVAVPIPGEVGVTVLGCEGRVAVRREPGVYTEGHVRVEVTPHDAEADRQLVFFQSPDAGSGGHQKLGMRAEHALGKTPVVYVPEPTGSAEEVTLRWPVIQTRGPWKVRIPLDAG